MFGDDHNMYDFYIGVDLGQSKDYTAISIIKRSGEPPMESSYELVFMQRPPLGTTYPRIIEGLKKILAKPEFGEIHTSEGPRCVSSVERGAKSIAIVVDATGVGRPVIDHMVAQGMNQVGRPIISVTITGGDHVTGKDPDYGVPKRDLVHNLLILLQAGRFTISSRLREYERLIREMQNFKVKISREGHDSYEAWREGEHDDMVLSIALALWYARHVEPAPEPQDEDDVQYEQDPFKRDRGYEDQVLFGGGGYS